MPAIVAWARCCDSKKDEMEKAVSERKSFAWIRLKNKP